MGLKLAYYMYSGQGLMQDKDQTIQYFGLSV